MECKKKENKEAQLVKGQTTFSPVGARFAVYMPLHVCMQPLPRYEWQCKMEKLG